jgi:hypothetical protein
MRTQSKASTHPNCLVDERHKIIRSRSKFIELLLSTIRLRMVCRSETGDSPQQSEELFPKITNDFWPIIRQNNP